MGRYTASAGQYFEYKIVMGEFVYADLIASIKSKILNVDTSHIPKDCSSVKVTIQANYSYEYTRTLPEGPPDIEYYIERLPIMITATLTPLINKIVYLSDGAAYPLTLNSSINTMNMNNYYNLVITDFKTLVDLNEINDDPDNVLTDVKGFIAVNMEFEN